MKQNTYKFGNFAETIAANFLRLKGYRILERRFKTKVGEVDIVAKKLRTLVFVEVKARRKNELIEVILRQHQINRIKKAAEFFLMMNQKYHDFDVRFDFILFNESLVPEHHEGYFE